MFKEVLFISVASMKIPLYDLQHRIPHFLVLH